VILIWLAFGEEKDALHDMTLALCLKKGLLVLLLFLLLYEDRKWQAEGSIYTAGGSRSRGRPTTGLCCLLTAI
jgi:hypothetical protein